MNATASGVPAAAARPGWEGCLELGFEQRGERSVLARRLHHGPLSVQRAFHPEPDGTCHTYVLHPPGGIVGGDRLRLSVDVAQSARVLLTTPAATKFYRSAGPRAEQSLRLCAGRDSQLEWLPQETIVYDAARLRNETRVELAEGAAFLGWEVLCFGRPVSGERFVRGAIEQRLEVYRGARPLLLERARYAGAGPELTASWGLGGRPVMGTLLCVAPDDRPLDANVVEALRAVLAQHAGPRAVGSQLAGAWVCRYLGDRVEEALLAFRAAWRVLRLACLHKPAVAPRIWAT